LKKVLRLYTDGAARGNPGAAGAGMVIEDGGGIRLRGLHRWLGHKTNNEAEYLALIDGLRAVAEWHPDRLEVFLDSKLVVEQISGECIQARAQWREAATRKQVVGKVVDKAKAEANMKDEQRLQVESDERAIQTRVRS